MGAEEREKSQELEKIDIVDLVLDYLRILRKMWIWVLIFALVGAGRSYVTARLSYSPIYTASSTFTINLQKDQQDEYGSSTYFDNATAEQMAKTFPYILTSGVLSRMVAKDLGVEAVSGSINATVAENTNLLTLSVTDRDAERAYTTLQSVIANYPAVSEVIVGRVNMEMLDETGIPAKADNPPYFMGNVKRGAATGVGLVILWAALLVVTRRTVRKEKDIHKMMNTRCLGVIPQVAQKRRTRKVQNKMTIMDRKVAEKMEEPLRIIRNKIEYNARTYDNKTYMITSALAGEGKSTVAVNLALSLAQTGKRVAIVDCDLRHPSDRGVLGLPDGPGLGEVLNKEIKLKDALLWAQNLGLPEDLPLLMLPGGAAMEDGSELLGTKHMQWIVGKMEAWADYVILDAAPAGLLTDAVVLAQYADAALFVVRKDFAKIDYIMDGMEHLAESNIQVVGGILNGA